MQIANLDLETRSKIYSHTKKVLRKYQKGIITGKLTADKFAENILSNESINDILDETLLSDEDFKSSYICYIDKLISMQNENSPKGKRSKEKSTPTKPTVPQKLKLKNLIASSDFTLSIPIEYLNACDIDSLIKFVGTGVIELGDERIYNYVHKSEKVN